MGLIEDCIESETPTPIDSLTQTFYVQLSQGGGNVSLGNALALRAAGQAQAITAPNPNYPAPGSPAHSPGDTTVPKFTFFIYDHLGNSRILYSNKLIDCNRDSTKYLLEHVLDYYPYGKTLREYVHNRERHQTTYHERDAESGLDFRGARLSDSEVGRFLSVDPLADWASDWVPYRYGFDNPVLYSDPLGLFETRQEAKDFKKQHNIKGKIRKDGDNFFIQERGEGGGQYAFGTSASGYGTSHSTNNPHGAGAFDRAIDEFWELMRAGDRWAEGGGGERFAQTVADLNPLVSGMNAYYGFTNGRNIYGHEIGEGESALYAVGALPLAPGVVNGYQYNGYEFNGDLGLRWYDYGWRSLDPATCRWNAIDPHGENYFGWSSYHYAANNPVGVMDIAGLDWYRNNETGKHEWFKGSDDIDGYENVGEYYQWFVKNLEVVH